VLKRFRENLSTFWLNHSPPDLERPPWSPLNSNATLEEKVFNLFSLTTKERGEPKGKLGITDKTSRRKEPKESTALKRATRAVGAPLKLLVVIYSLS